MKIKRQARNNIVKRPDIFGNSNAVFRVPLQKLAILRKGRKERKTRDKRASNALETLKRLHCPSSPIASPNFLYAAYQLIQVLIVGSNRQFVWSDSPCLSFSVPVRRDTRYHSAGMMVAGCLLCLGDLHETICNFSRTMGSQTRLPWCGLGSAQRGSSKAEKIFVVLAPA
jgi:hypothetical protein